MHWKNISQKWLDNKKKIKDKRHLKKQSDNMKKMKAKKKNV